ncbi:MAG: hypothetical protein ACXWCN_15915, partial [Caldimonas sp.]
SFIDPPSLQLAEAGAAQPLPARAPGIDSQTASLADIARQADASRRGGSSAAGEVEPPSRTARRSTRVHGVVATAASSGPARARRHHASARVVPRSRTALAAAPRVGGARLRLDPPRLLAAVPAPAASAPAPTVALVLPSEPMLAEASAAVPAVSAAASQAAAEQERIQSLEAGLARLRSDSQATQQTVAELQARLRQAESARYRNGLVYALLGTTLLGFLVAAALWWLRPRQRRRARWFDAQASQQERAGRASSSARAWAAAPEVSLPAESRPAQPAASLRPAPPAWREAPASVLQVTTPATIGGLEVTTVLGPELSRSVLDHRSDDGTAATRRGGELSMEELIDLEQQAEFFVVLGQDEAAIALLDAYVREPAGKSPLPFLQLLEIHQRRGDQPAYDRVRESFNERFNAYAPDWSSALHLGRSLEHYPQTVARLQSLWTTPLSAMQALDNLLFRRHAAEDTFDFPAYRELLFLYSIARELSGNVETDFGSIDLFLPLDEVPVHESHDRLEGASGSVDLDVSNWPEDATMSDLLVRRSPTRRDAA